jgi:hypothetical protein
LTLPPLPGIAEVRRRLERLFPEGTEHRNHLVREMAARTVWVFLYGGMLEGSGRLLRPSHVYLFTHEQAEKQSDAERHAWFEAATRPRFRPPGQRWYADTTREPIRDETLRFGLLTVGAVSRAAGVATTSSKPVYGLADDFARLFDPGVHGTALDDAIDRWRSAHLSGAARMRQAVVAAGRAGSADQVLVRCPDGSVLRLAPGPSSNIAKAVVEEFAPRFLGGPERLLWACEAPFELVSLVAGIQAATTPST